MKYLALILIFAASSAFAEGKEVVWTSDSTYVRGGVEYWDPVESWIKDFENDTFSDPEYEYDYSRYWIYDAPRLKKVDLDDQREEMIV